jgi:hypothetical protein
LCGEDHRSTGSVRPPAECRGRSPFREVGPGRTLGGKPGVRWGLKARKKEADQQIERSLYQRGPRLQLRRGQDIHAGRSKETIYAPYVEHAPPDTTAAIFWLKSRDPANWRDAWQIENVTGKYVISDKPMTEAEWIKELAVLIDGGDGKDVTPLAVEDKSK